MFAVELTNGLTGIVLVAVALALAALCAAPCGTYAASFVGKAIWFAPYAAFVTVLRAFARA